MLEKINAEEDRGHGTPGRPKTKMLRILPGIYRLTVSGVSYIVRAKGQEPTELRGIALRLGRLNSITLTALALDNGEVADPDNRAPTVSMDDIRRLTIGLP